ncbi:MAG: substrate-binding domain-containing protein [Sphingomonadales bacterium]|jgi:phosphate transport system substrate-binding protein
MRNSFWVIAILVFTACSNYDYQGEGKDVPTAGKVNIWADFADSLMLTQMKDVFESKYPKADIRFTFASETDILKAVNEGICRICILHRDFFEQEKEALENRNFKVRSVKFAKSSIALVANRNASADAISESELKALLAANTGSSQKKLCFDRKGGNNYMFFYRRFQLNNHAQPNVISLSGPHAVMDWVASHPEFIGFVGVNTIADKTDTLALHYQRKVKILQVNTDSTGLSYPFQSQIYTRQYPFIQDVYIHDLQGYSGLGSGFAAWICSQPGQILVKKSGLLPCFDAGRTVEVDTE